MLKIGIVGLGLIGGSIEQRLKAFPDKYEILSVSESQQRPYKLEDLVEADIVFLCGSQSQIMKDLESIAKIILASGKDSGSPENAFAKTLITDVASTKMPACNKAQELGLKNFVGGHPMAGTEHQGFAASFPQMFEEAKWILTESNPATQKLEKLIKEDLGATLVIMDPDTHDKSVALVSHLPLILSLGLADLASSFSPATKITGPGFLSMTRLSRGNPELGKEIISLNRKNIKDAWTIYKQEVESILNIYGDDLGEELAAIKERLAAAIIA